ncbi:MAG: hypothetical protein FWG98_03525 [Candidatus Cloacimonetes bacterium]|nr:hypothetical protein [Candidatus Cloacimonadota bacterium]
MKQILLLCMSIFFSLLVAEANFQSYFNTYNQFSLFENQFIWEKLFQNDLTLAFETSYQNSQNSHFDRSSKNTNYNYLLSFDRHIFQPFILANYSSFYNSGMPEDTLSVSDKYLRQAGLGYSASFLQERIFIRQSGSYLRVDNPQKYYSGWLTDTRVNFQDLFQNTYVQSSLYHTNNDTFLERNNAYGMDFLYRYNNINNVILRLRYDMLAKDIYLYNEFDDRSSRDEYLAHINMSYRLTERFDFMIDNRANFRRLNHEENITRNNWFFENNFDYLLNYRYIFGQYFARLNLQNRTRYLKSNDQSRESDEKQITIGGLWSFAVVDTLRFEVGNSILRNFHSGEHSFLDNDRVMTTYSLFTNSNFNRHWLKNTMQIFNGKQVYIDRLLSANNQDILIYQWIPEAEFYLHKNIRFYNKYVIRADYDYFIWHDFLKDRFYRYLSGEWGIRFINGNMIFSNSSISLDNLVQTYQLKDNNYYDRFEVYTAFILEHNETAENDEGVWYINNSEYMRTYLLSVNYIRNNVFLRIQPVVKYFNESFESEVQVDLNLIFGDLILNTSINPIGRQFNEMIWRFNLNVMYRF